MAGITTGGLPPTHAQPLPRQRRVGRGNPIRQHGHLISRHPHNCSTAQHPSPPVQGWPHWRVNWHHVMLHRASHRHRHRQTHLSLACTQTRASYIRTQTHSTPHTAPHYTTPHHTLHHTHTHHTAHHTHHTPNPLACDVTHSTGMASVLLCSSTWGAPVWWRVGPVPDTSIELGPGRGEGRGGREGLQQH